MTEQSPKTQQIPQISQKIEKNEIPNIGEFEKKENNPLFSHIKQSNQQYIDTLEFQTQLLKLKHPQKYKKFQAIGESYMNLGFDLEVGRDDEGDRFTAQQILYPLQNRVVTMEELTDQEKKLLVKVYGENWTRFLDN